MLAAIFNVHGHQKFGARFALQYRRAAGSQEQLIILAPARNAIGKCRQDRKRQRVGIVRVRFGRADDAANLFEVALR